MRGVRRAPCPKDTPVSRINTQIVVAGSGKVPQQSCSKCCGFSEEGQASARGLSQGRRPPGGGAAVGP